MSRMIPFAFDTETFLVNTRGKATTKTVPRLVCLSAAEDGKAPVLLERERALPYIVDQLNRDDLVFYGHNVAFDMLVVIRAVAEDLALDLGPRIFELYSQGRVRDTMIREQLYDIERGGLYRRGRYGLADLSKRRLGEKVVGKTGKDAWRMRYNELEGLRSDAYPAAAAEYALLDAVYTLAIAKAQGDFVLNEDFQTTAAFGLALISAWGLRVDPEWAAAVDAWYARLEAVAKDDLVASGLALASGTIPKKRKEALVRDAFASLGQNPPLTPTGAIKTDKKTLALLEKAGINDPRFAALTAYNRARKLRATYLEPLLDAAEADAPLCPRYNATVDSGRTSSANPNIQNLVSRLTLFEKNALKWFYESIDADPREGISALDRLRHPAGFAVGPDIRGAIIPRPGKVFVGADYSAIEMAGLAQVIKNWTGTLGNLGKSINAGEDQHLRIVAAMRGISYEHAVELYESGDASVDFDRFLGKCFHPDTEVLTVHGWTRIPDLVEGEPVMAASVGHGNRETVLGWQVPTGYHRKSDYTELVHVDSQDAKLAVTADHGIPTWTRRGTCHREEAGGDFWGRDRELRCAGVEGEFVLGDDSVELRLAVATQADGSIDDYGNVRFGFTKQRKADRLRTLLERLDCAFTERNPEINGKPGFTFYVPRPAAAPFLALLDEDKTLPWSFVGLSPALRAVVLNEAAHWDGTTTKGGRSFHYSSTIEKNVDVLTAVAAITGCKAKALPPEVYDNPQHATLYSVAIADRSESRTANYKVERRPYAGDVFCLTVPSGAVLVRYHGATCVVHQSANYGFAGGASAETWVDFVRSLGADVTLSTSERVRLAWFTAWPEMDDFRERVSACKTPSGEYFMEQHGPQGQTSGWRNRLCDRFTSALNTMFQGIVADGCKYALWLLASACYIETDSPLFGARVVIFEHDAFYLEVDEDRAEACGEELTRLMVEGMSLFIPDVRVEADYDILTERWGK